MFRFFFCVCVCVFVCVVWVYRVLLGSRVQNFRGSRL